MNKKEYLSEETYQKNKKKITIAAFVILLVGLLIGGSLIATGLIKKIKIESKYSDDNKVKIEEQMAKEKQNLVNSKTELENKIKPVEDEIKSLERERYTPFEDGYYARQYKIEELKKSIATDVESIIIIEDVLVDETELCRIDKEKYNIYTSKYCTLKKQFYDFTHFDKFSNSDEYIPFFIIGGFIMFSSCIVFFWVYSVAKQREIFAFTTQQQMPVAQEGIEKMTPTIGKTTEAIAQSITKGIKEGLKDDDK